MLLPDKRPAQGRDLIAQQRVILEGFADLVAAVQHGRVRAPAEGFADLRQRLDAVLLPTEDHPHLRQLERELQEYFSGERQEFDVPLDTPTTPFRQRVWDELRTIPYGETRTYAQQAQRIGQPTATRAVASANGQNRVAIVIPCHRVIGSDGSLTGYAGGLARKQWLLDLEKRG